MHLSKWMRSDSSSNRVILEVNLFTCADRYWNFRLAFSMTIIMDHQTDDSEELQGWLNG